MAYVVTEACIQSKYSDCVTDCPTGFFREGMNMLVIDPTDCIDCNLCAKACPVGAIYPDHELPSKWKHYTELNERLGALWPEILLPKEVLPCAEEFREKENKAHLLDETPFSPE